MSRGAPTLLRLVAGRVLLFGLAAMAIQLAVVVVSYWRDDELLGRGLIAQETDRLAAGLDLRDGAIRFALPAALDGRYGAAAQTARARAEGDDIGEGYYARIRTRAGAVLFSNCGEECAEHFLPLTLNPPTFWERVIRPGKPLVFAGGRTVVRGTETVHLEIAVVGDPEFLVGAVLAEEIEEHMVVPMTLMLTLVIGATILSIRQSLGPVTAAAAAAGRIDPTDPSAHIATAGMPAEIERFASAVNRSLGRVGALVRSQKLFTSAIAHEIRTPLAAATLELERVEDPRASKARADLDSITHVLEQLTALARLETVGESAFERIDLARLGEDLVGRLAPAVYAGGRSIAFADAGATPVRGVPALAESLLRNLVENAARHTPPGTAIAVTAGPGPVLRVADDGPGFDPAAKRVEAGRGRSSGGLGIGLEIVDRIAGLHGATVDFSPASASGGHPGTVAAITFPG